MLEHWASHLGPRWEVVRGGDDDSGGFWMGFRFFPSQITFPLSFFDLMVGEPKKQCIRP